MQDKTINAFNEVGIMDRVFLNKLLSGRGELNQLNFNSPISKTFKDIIISQNYETSFFLKTFTLYLLFLENPYIRHGKTFVWIHSSPSFGEIKKGQ